MGIDRSIIVEERNVGNPEYQITDELMQWMEDFNADKKLSPITCFIEHRGVDIFTGVNALNGTVGIVENKSLEEQVRKPKRFKSCVIGAIVIISAIGTLWHWFK